MLSTQHVPSLLYVMVCGAGRANGEPARRGRCGGRPRHRPVPHRQLLPVQRLHLPPPPREGACHFTSRGTPHNTPSPLTPLTLSPPLPSPPPATLPPCHTLHPAPHTPSPRTPHPTPRTLHPRHPPSPPHPAPCTPSSTPPYLLLRCCVRARRGTSSSTFSRTRRTASSCS